MASVRGLLSRLLTPSRQEPRGSRRSAAPGRSRVQDAPQGSGVRIQYAPDPDGDPDPGEVVWTWVPYEEDTTQGKDRPVLLVARHGRALVGLMLSSRNHDDDPGEWYGLGAGGWDAEGRPSWVRLDRVIDVDPVAMRREGATLDRRRFDLVAARLRSLHGWT